MANKVGMSQVKFKVRHNALLLREFTTAEMIAATGLNPESVRTEIQRMKQERLLTSNRGESKHKKRGGPESIYKLTNDPEARLRLSDSIETFFSPIPSHDKPTSRHYLLAKGFIDQAFKEMNPTKKKLLDEAEHALAMAEQAEGGTLAPDLIKAYLHYERSRLLYSLGKWEEAKRHFRELGEFFTHTKNDQMLDSINEYLLCLQALDRFDEGMPKEVGEFALARCLTSVLSERNYKTNSPLLTMLWQLVQKLSETVDEKIRAQALEMAIEVGKREIGMKMEQAIQFGQMRVAYETTKLMQGELRSWQVGPVNEQDEPTHIDNWSWDNPFSAEFDLKSKQSKDE